VSEENREPSRIILPGGAKPGGLVGPDGRPISSFEPEPAEDASALPANPRLRALEIQETTEGGRALVVLIDPSGIAPQALAISAEALPILMLLDGSVALADLVELVNRETGDPRAGANITTLVDELDKRLLLESPRYFAARDAARAAYRAEPVRKAALAGVSYPADALALTGFLGAQDEIARAWRAGTAPAPGLSDEENAKARERIPPAAPRALAAPHIDLRRGGNVVARAYLELADVPTEQLPDVFFVFGTGHGLLEEPFAITAKAFETPLGTVATDENVVRWIEEACGPSILAEEIANRDEHAIEFQAVALRHRLGERPFRIVPILCGGFHGLVRYERRPAEEPRVEALVSACAAAAARLERDGVKVAFVAGIDLAHMGARFGDAVDMDEETLASVARHDREALAAAQQGDAEAWFDAIAAHGDSTRICGFAAMYTMLRVAQAGTGRLLAYEQSLEEGGSVVSYAAMAWP